MSIFDMGRQITRPETTEGFAEMRSFHDVDKVVDVAGIQYRVHIPIEISDWSGIGIGSRVDVGRIRFTPVASTKERTSKPLKDSLRFR